MILLYQSELQQFC